MDECIASPGNAKCFTTLDANYSYWQVEISENDKDKISFTCHAGLFRFLQVPFGLRNAVATFQGGLDIII